jgi:hypothetical protein
VQKKRKYVAHAQDGINRKGVRIQDGAEFAYDRLTTLWDFGEAPDHLEGRNSSQTRFTSLTLSVSIGPRNSRQIGLAFRCGENAERPSVSTHHFETWS